MKIEFSETAEAECDKILANYPEKRAAMLPVLYLAEKEFGHISLEVEEYVGKLLDVPPVKVHEVMTFYTLIAAKPRGKYHFQICRGLSCDLKGCVKIIDYLSEKLKLSSDETSDNLMYTFTPVECLAACETAPKMQLNEDYHGNLTKEKIDNILKENS